MEKPDVTILRRLVQEFFQHDTTGHDWWHVNRVTHLALFIGKHENADLRLVEPAALVHDTDDWKLMQSSTDFLNARHMLALAGYSSQWTETIIGIVSQVSFKGAGVDTRPTSIEAMVVQDADRLDAIGAIGIARAFAYGGARNRPMYVPGQQPKAHASFEEYKSSNGHTVNHFYEKLLLLRDRMNTPTARKLAEERHRFMEQFLKQFYSEWNFEA